MSENLDDWMKSGKYLPKFMRDFHNQKDVFKTIHRIINPENESLKKVNWIDGHCYVIDIFLWFMARRGWTLQRSRVKTDFRDLNLDIEAVKAEDTEAFRQMLQNRSQPKGVPDES